MYYVYIIQSSITDKYYTGSTAEIESRLSHHNGGYNRSTKAGAPWRLVKVLELHDRTEALQMELKIKKRGAKRFLQDSVA